MTPRRGLSGARTVGLSGAAVLLLFAVPVLSAQDPSAEAADKLWSLRPISESPALADWSAARRTSPEAIDALLRASQLRRGLEAAPLAPRRTLIRRLSFDVRGLPPTSAEVEAFVRDPRRDAWRRLVDRMLATRAYAENQARHWLDLARYADTAGDSSDYPLPEAWRYRDWVIEAFARDMPWPDFIRQQIAGDLVMQGFDPDAIVATGYIALSRRFGVKVRQWSHLVREDTLDTIGRGLMGLTLSCARCHDHKFDPITQKDYAALEGFFSSTRYPHPGCEVLRESKDLVDLVPPERVQAELAEWEAKVAAARSHLKAREAALAKDKTKATRRAHARARDALTRIRLARPLPQAYGVVDAKRIVDARVQIGGVPKARGPVVARGFPRAIVGPDRPSAPKDRSGRAELAEWLVDPRHPLVPRVLVNRLWQQCFGRGIVATPDDFGTRGAAPSLPALLDHLALRFVEDRSIRSSLRRILLTEAYRRSSTRSSGSRTGEDVEDPDPDNRYFARQSIRRLRAESYRDALLMLSGELRVGSPGPQPFPPPEKRSYSQHHPFVGEYPSLRRSIYCMRQRLRAHGVFEVFDGADPCAVTGKRASSIVPTQALWLRNSDFARARVAAFAKRFEPRSDLALAADRATRLALGRGASAREQADLRVFVQRAREEGIAWRDAWRSWCHVLVCSTEFAYVR